MTRHLAGLLAALTLAAGCRGPKSPEELRKAECEKNPERVALFREGERPSRPYRVLTEVGATWFASTASRTRTLQVKACQLGADAVIDVSSEPHGASYALTGTKAGTITFHQRGRTEEGRGLAIRFVDDADGTTPLPASATTVAPTSLDSAASIPPPTRPARP